MSKRITIPKATKGRAYSGVWYDGSVGWFGTNHVSERFTGGISPRLLESPFAQGRRAYLCTVTLTPILDKRGRPITRIIRKAK